MTADALAGTVDGVSGFGDLFGRLLIQCRPRQAHVAAAVADAHQSGLVITGTKALTKARELRAGGFRWPILCDAARYVGTRRVPGARGIHPAWCRAQHEISEVALTDSGFLRSRDQVGLQAILRAAQREPRPTIALLPMAVHWLRYPAYTKALVDQLNRFGVPVAVTFEHAGDPFSTQYAVRGIRALLTAKVPVLLLRSDISALGALCNGAYAAAVGTGTALRHIAPVSTGGGGRRPSIAALVPHLLDFRSTDRIVEAAARNEDLAQFWECRCDECAGRPIARFDRISDLQLRETTAFRHSLHSLLDLHTDLRRPGLTAGGLALTWQERCSHALNLHRELTDHDETWHAPRYLSAWYETGKLLPDNASVGYPWNERSSSA